MNTEITDNNAKKPAGWIFYDAACRFCVGGRRRWGAVFERRGYVWLPLQTPGTAARFGVTQDQLMAEMWVLSAGGRPLNGVNAWIELLRRVWWLSPIGFLLSLPGIKSVGQLVYRWIARSRYCLSGACDLNRGEATSHRHSAFLELP